MIADELWCSGTGECLDCGHAWPAVWPLAADDLECPGCGSTNTVREDAPALTGGDGGGTVTGG